MKHFILLALPVLFLSACDRDDVAAKNALTTTKAPTAQSNQAASEPAKPAALPALQTITGLAQGTTYSVKYWRQDNGIKPAALKPDIDAELARIDKVMSNYRDDSDIAVFNQQKVADEPIALNAEILDLLKISAEVHEKSLGCYDPTIGPLFKIWGFKKDSLNIPSDEQINAKRQLIGFADKLTRQADSIVKEQAGTTVDLSAIGQGYAVAKINAILQQHDINNALTEIGGEMLVTGTKPEGKPWRVGVERPAPNSKKVSEIITLTGKRQTAVMTSGTYRHYFDKQGKRYSHILDPRTGKPVEHDSVAVTVLLDDATYADAWSTALLCLGSKTGLAVANKEQIPAVFYDMKDGKLVRHESQAVATEQANWQIKRAN